jgi:RsiW-degrading membrane proteinase PrsW (M82 family)
MSGHLSDSRRPSSGPFPHYSFSSLVPIRHWVRDPALRSWPVLLLIALVCVPPIAMVLLNQPTPTHLHDAGWIFAYYFAIGWLLLLAVVVSPQHVTRSMLAAAAGIGIVTQVPIALWLEDHLHDSTTSLPASIFTVGVPEELAKALPVLVVAWIWRRKWHTQTPWDYLFLGAVSGLVFGALEAERYFTLVLGSLFGTVNGAGLQWLTIHYVWRFVTDPIDHACWAGITGYFIGLAITGRVPRYQVGLAGICIAAVLHGLNDWTSPHLTWVLVDLISVLLFLGYARVGARMPEPPQATAGQGPTPAAPWSGGSPGTAAPSAPGNRPRRTCPWAAPVAAAPLPVPGQAAPGSPPIPDSQPISADARWQAPTGTPRPAPSAGQPAAGRHRAARPG